MVSSDVYTNSYLDSMRLLGDKEADLFIQHQFADATLKAELQSWLAALNTNIQLETALNKYGEYNFISSAGELPEWADKKQMQIGTAFFARHAEAIMSMLGLLSLPYCYAAAEGASVLYASERLRNDTGKRLFETASFVWDVMAPEAFTETGNGLASILKVRLMHAAARYYTLKSPGFNESVCMPINQEDMAGTNLSFSLIVVRGLRKLGFSVDHTDQKAFFHLWNVIGYLLGLDENLLPRSAKNAQVLESNIRSRHFRTSLQGRNLTKSLTDFLSGMSDEASGYTATEILSLMCYLLGDDIAVILAIEASPLSASKIRLLKGINLMKDLKPLTEPAVAYREAYYKFRKQLTLNN